MKYKFLYAFFLLFPLVCQAENLKNLIFKQRNETAHELRLHIRHYSAEWVEIYDGSWENQYWFLYGKLKTYDEVCDLIRECENVHNR